MVAGDRHVSASGRSLSTWSVIGCRNRPYAEGASVSSAASAWRTPCLTAGVTSSMRPMKTRATAMGLGRTIQREHRVDGLRRHRVEQEARKAVGRTSGRKPFSNEPLLEPNGDVDLGLVRRVEVQHRRFHPHRADQAGLHTQVPERLTKHGRSDWPPSGSHSSG